MYCTRSLYNINSIITRQQVGFVRTLVVELCVHVTSRVRAEVACGLENQGNLRLRPSLCLVHLAAESQRFAAPIPDNFMAVNLLYTAIMFTAVLSVYNSVCLLVDFRGEAQKELFADKFSVTKYDLHTFLLIVQAVYNCDVDDL